ncbi:hypothetical protein ACIA8G_20400 [Lentzea sp. NPDC051213]|uniref:hypothetical protein n=1 Tax=Lentzea sp. NPDC051213 TaxID=3364126 RepID=UPI0037953096
MTHQLAHAGTTFVNFSNGTYRWVHITRFRIPAVADDSSALAALIEHELYGNNYAGGDPGDDPTRHGPYWRDRVTPAVFDLVGGDTAESRLRAWARQEKDPPETVSADLEREVFQPLRAAERVYRLRDLGDDALHDWGGVLWEYEEHVLIGPALLTLVVAAID